jgi:hypothetical protein
METFIAILIMFVLALVLIAAAGAFSRVSRTASRSFRCPLADRDVTADFEEDVWGGPPTGVSRCSAFEPATAITCGRHCLGNMSPAVSAQT